jgi:hypothetical protein
MLEFANKIFVKINSPYWTVYDNGLGENWTSA